MTYVSQRDISGSIHSQTNISTKLMKFGTKVSYSLLFQNSFISHCLTIISYIVSRMWIFSNAIVWILCRMHEKQQLNYIFMLLSAIFVIPDSHFGEEMEIKWHIFCKGTFQGLSFAGKVYQLESRNLVQNSYGLPLQKYIYIFIYIIVFDNHFTHRLQNLRCKGRLPPPQNTKFWPSHRWWHMVANISSSTSASLKLNSNWIQNIRYKSISGMYVWLVLQMFTYVLVVSVHNNVKSFIPDSFKILQLHLWWYI